MKILLARRVTPQHPLPPTGLTDVLAPSQNNGSWSIQTKGALGRCRVRPTPKELFKESDMKHFILWGSLIGSALLMYVLFTKTTTLTIFAEKTSPLYVDVIFFMLGVFVAISRGITIIQKISQ